MINLTASVGEDFCARCLPGLCHPAEGICKQCLPGFSEPKCQGIDTICPHGRHSLNNCSAPCSAPCVNGTTCQNATGVCVDGCLPGYFGDQCDQLCPPGFFGESCRNKCNRNCVNETCDPFSGDCFGCNTGFTGPFCDQKWKSPDGKSEQAELDISVMATAVGSFLAIVVIGSLVCVSLAVISFLKDKWMLKHLQHNWNPPPPWDRRKFIVYRSKFGSQSKRHKNMLKRYELYREHLRRNRRIELETAAAEGGEGRSQVSSSTEMTDSVESMRHQLNRILLTLEKDPKKIPKYPKTKRLKKGSDERALVGILRGPRQNALKHPRRNVDNDEDKSTDIDESDDNVTRASLESKEGSTSTEQQDKVEIGIDERIHIVPSSGNTSYASSSTVKFLGVEPSGDEESSTTTTTTTNSGTTTSKTTTDATTNTSTTTPASGDTSSASSTSSTTTLTSEHTLTQESSGSSPTLLENSAADAVSSTSLDRSSTQASSSKDESTEVADSSQEDNSRRVVVSSTNLIDSNSLAHTRARFSDYKTRRQETRAPSTRSSGDRLDRLE